MLQVNIKHIPESGLDIETTLSPEELDFKSNNRIQEITPVICELKASMVEKDLVIRGTSNLVANCKCDRCLQDLELLIESEDICIVIEDTPEIVDLTNDIREDILLAFPPLFVCKAECKGLCFNCGQNLNEAECQCDLESDSSSPWDTLDNLNFDDKK
jgi:uncharacterized protein